METAINTNTLKDYVIKKDAWWMAPHEASAIVELLGQSASVGYHCEIGWFVLNITVTVFGYHQQTLAWAEFMNIDEQPPSTKNEKR